MGSNITIDGVCKLLKQAETILLFAHRRPDGDALGSVPALKKGLEDLGKTVYAVCCDSVTERLLFLTESEILPSLLPADLGEYLPVAVDVASEEMLGSAIDLFKGKTTLRIDHHATGSDFADDNYVRPSASATGEIVFDLLEALDAWSLPAAERVYAAIASDTGCFKYSNVTPETHRKAASLLEMGVKPDEINRRLFDNRSRGETEAFRMALDALRYCDGGRVAVINFTNEMKKKGQLTEEDLSDISSIPRTVRGVSVGAVIKQESADPRLFKVSMRSDRSTDVSAICARMGGGGHFSAAGVTIEADSPEAAEKRVIEEILHG